MRRLAPLLFAFALAAPRPLPAQTPGYDELAGGQGPGVGAQVTPESQRRAQDRTMILFLADHVKKVDGAIVEMRKAKQEILDEARRREEEIAAQKAEAERRRRQANSRAAGNALLLLSGASADDVNTYNRIQDVADVITARTPAERQAASRRTLAPNLLLLAGADVRTVNDLDTYGSAFSAIGASNQVRTLEGALARARQGSAAAAAEARDVDEQIKALEAERIKALDLLHGYATRYLASVNAITGRIRGFPEAFGAVKDLAFDFSQTAESREPLIFALTITLRGETVDVRLKDIAGFLADRFAGLIATREASVRDAEAKVRAGEAAIAALATRRTTIEGQIRAKETEKAGLTGVRNVFARQRIDTEITRLRGTLPSSEEDRKAAADLAGARTALTGAQALLARARTARDLLDRIDAPGAGAALAQIRALL